LKAKASKFDSNGEIHLWLSYLPLLMRESDRLIDNYRIEGTPYSSLLHRLTQLAYGGRVEPEDCGRDYSIVLDLCAISAADNRSVWRQSAGF
jgi:hypothetical protein